MRSASPASAGAFVAPKVQGPVETLLLVFGDQLDPRAPALAALDPARDAILMVEVEEESRHVKSNKQRTTLFLSAMRHFARAQTARGLRVEYVTLEDPDNTQRFDRPGTSSASTPEDGEVPRAVARLSPERLRMIEPGEHRLASLAAAWESRLKLPVEILPDPHFLVSREEFARWAKGKKQLVLEYFYREVRKRHRILLEDDGSPIGGQWNFDKENRESFSKAPRAPAPLVCEPDAITAEVMALVEARFPEHPGRLDHFFWPVTREAALEGLDKFIRERLPEFGTHQDAMWTGERTLWHSLLSPALNLKLLDPREVVERAVAEYRARRAPLNAVEGFVRQVIGWREFIRGVYWHEGESYAQRNGLDQHGRLPDFYWGWSRTEARCLDESLRQVVEDGYGHHIQRLMVTGNFALTAGVHPRAVSDWYLAMYVDAIDWVTLPNALGMVMHADGGVVGTKPYASTGKYIDRMSNYCEGCKFDPGERTGPKACPFTTFYWDFLLRNQVRLKNNMRLKLQLANVDRLEAPEKEAIQRHAETLRERFGIGSIDGG